MSQEIITQAISNTTGVTLSFQVFFNIAVVMLSFIGGFFVNRLFLKLDRLAEKDDCLTEEIHNLSVTLPTKYVMKEDLQRLSDALFTKLDSIEAKIDRKEDKK